MVNWNSDDIKEFKKQARATQQEYDDLLGDREWDVIEKWEWTILRKKVGFGLYGPPPFEPSGLNRQTGYKKEQLDQIEKICDQLVDELNFKHQNILFACIFVVGKIWKERFTVPVFKAKRDSKNTSWCNYVDNSARKYSSWTDDYLQKNKLPKCVYCYPTHGKYESNTDNEVRVSFGTSPACDLVNRVFSVFDNVATVVTLGATVVGVAALCTIPIAGPILAVSAVAGASTGVYGVARSGHALYDRATHNQSIGLDDAEARGCWLAIVGSSLGFAQGGLISSMTNAARAGEVMGKAGRIVFMVVQTGSLTVNGIGIIHGLAVLIDKSERKELTALDVFQFSASLLFFTNAAVNMKTASTIIKEVQHDVINSHRKELSPEAKKLFNKQTGKLRGPREMHGNAEVVKQLNRIENSKDLYEMMVDKNVKNVKVKLTPEGYKGLLEVNKNLKIHPLKLLEIPASSRQDIFNATNNLSNGLLSTDQFHVQMKAICKQHQISFESMRKETLAKLCDLYGTTEVSEIKVGGRKIFTTATPHEVDRLRVVLEQTAQNNSEIIDMATKFAESRGCTSTKDFILYAEYFAADLSDIAKNYESQYQNDLKAAKTQPNFNNAKFDRDRGIIGKRKQFFKEEALNKYRGDNAETGYEDLTQRFEDLKSRVTPLNQRCKPAFGSDNSATYHYLKHKEFGSRGVLTTEEYFQLAQEIVGTPTNKRNAMLSQEGNCTMITYIDPVNKVKAIVVNQHQTGKDISIIATVLYDANAAKARD